jgi:hypothetical protein
MYTINNPRSVKEHESLFSQNTNTFSKYKLPCTLNNIGQSLHKAREESTSVNKKEFELRVICVIAGEWWKPNCLLLYKPVIRITK